MAGRFGFSEMTIGPIPAKFSDCDFEVCSNYQALKLEGSV